jgi:hypothetical protein
MFVNDYGLHTLFSNSGRIVGDKNGQGESFNTRRLLEMGQTGRKKAG